MLKRNVKITEVKFIYADAEKVEREINQFLTDKANTDEIWYLDKIRHRDAYVFAVLSR